VGKENVKACPNPQKGKAIVVEEIGERLAEAENTKNDEHNRQRLHSSLKPCQEFHRHLLLYRSKSESSDEITTEEEGKDHHRNDHQKRPRRNVSPVHPCGSQRVSNGWHRSPSPLSGEKERKGELIPGHDQTENGRSYHSHPHFGKDEPEKGLKAGIPVHQSCFFVLNGDIIDETAHYPHRKSQVKHCIHDDEPKEGVKKPQSPVHHDQGNGNNDGW
jgi:hypothetical protein